MFTIYIDNKPHQVKEGQNLLQACLSLGFDLPYFCWHPALHSVGACRQCAVKVFKDDKDTRGRITMSCMTPVAEGMRLSIDDADARAFRSSVIEWLMLNHPHDCPVCDEGGECHLQDMTLMTGHNYRRTRFKKRTHRNQNLGPFINHEMNRCIQCYRCVRFYRNYAGGRDFTVFASHDNVYFGRHEEGALENVFSGNLVEVCPTGVFTDKTLKQHSTRKWDLQTAPSICIHCGVGCNTIPGERYGTLRRILNRYNYEINGYFLCDRGRFGYEFVNSGRRIRKALLKATTHEVQAPADKTAAISKIQKMLSQNKVMIGIGSPRASLESNFALRTLVGPDNFCSGLSDQEHTLMGSIVDILQRGPARTPSLHEIESADAVFVLGEDVTNTAPMLALSIRQSAQNRQRETAAVMTIPGWDDNAVRNAGQNSETPLYIASGSKSQLDDVATKTYQASAADIAGLGIAVAHELDQHVPPVPDQSPDVRALAKEIAAALKNAKRPVIVSGTGCMSQAIIEAAANIAWALCSIGRQAGLCYTVLECNTMGLALMKGKNLDEAFKSIRDGQADTMIILENDLFRRAEAKIVDEALGHAKNIIVLDSLVNPTSSKADVTLPAATFAEAHGTLMNNEGRVQRFYQVFKPNHDIQESWKWIRDILATIGKSTIWHSFDDIAKDMSAAMPVFGPAVSNAPSADWRIKGQKIPRQPHRYSGRTAMIANIRLHEPKPPNDADSPLAFSMEGYQDQPPPSLITRYWSPGWNSVQALNKFQQDVGGPLKGGDTGESLIGVETTVQPVYFNLATEALNHTKNKQVEIPVYNIFGSEELSAQSPAIVERAKLIHSE
jgi:NADH-quinone oxidoreductase subunit G